MCVTALANNSYIPTKTEPSLPKGVTREDVAFAMDFDSKIKKSAKDGVAFNPSPEDVKKFNAIASKLNISPYIPEKQPQDKTALNTEDSSKIPNETKANTNHSFIEDAKNHPIKPIGRSVAEGPSIEDVKKVIQKATDKLPEGVKKAVKSTVETVKGIVKTVGNSPTLQGAAIGGVVGGIPGAIIGGMIGFSVGKLKDLLLNKQKTDEDKNEAKKAIGLGMGVAIGATALCPPAGIATGIAGWLLAKKATEK
ncbi:MAG: hypothetical protein U0457_07890 [Candidatus Sericytochromatia bacterium]